jgi:PAS domain S-box-containing protein
MKKSSIALHSLVKTQKDDIMTCSPDYNSPEELHLALDALQQRVAELETTVHQQARIIDEIHDAVITTTLDGYITKWNARATHLLEYAADAVLGQHMSMLYPPDLHEFLHHNILAALHEHGTHTCEIRLRRKSGTDCFVQLTLSLLREDDGTPIGIISYARDITAQRESQRALETERQQLFALLDELPAYVYLQAPDYTIRFANRRFHEQFGDPSTRPCYAVLKGKAEPCEGCMTFLLFEDPETPRIWETETIDQRTYQVFDYPFWEHDGSLLVLELGIDITERKQAEEALRIAHSELEQRVHQRTQELIEINQALEKEIIERQRAEDSLRFHQAFLQGIIDNMPAAVYVKDMDGHYILTNTYYAELLNKDRAAILGKKDADLFPLDIAKECQVSDEQVLGTGRTVEIEQVFPQQDNPHTYMTLKFLIYDANDASCAIGGIATDITGRKRDEEALRESEARYRAIVENQTEFICRFRPDGTLTYVNDAYCRFFGKRYEELIRRNFLAFLLPEDREAIRVHLASFTTEQPVARIKHRIINEWGEIRWQQWTDQAFFDDQGRVLEFQSVGRDITEQQAREDQSEFDDRRYERLLKTITNYIYTVMIQDGQPISTVHSSGCSSITGYQSEEYQADPHLWYRMIYPEDRDFVMGMVQRLLAGETLPSFEHRILHKDGSVRWIRNTPSLHYNKQGLLVAYDGLITDITERKQAEEALIAERASLARRVAERTASLSVANAELERSVRVKNEFLATISHELRTPLNAILGMTRTLKDQSCGPLNEHQEEMLHIVESSGNHLLAQINDILDLSRIEAGKLSLIFWPVQVERMCQVSLEQFKGKIAQKHLNVALNIAPDLPDLNADERRVKQIMNNLLSNAVKFTLHGGSIGLDVWHDVDNGCVVLSVWDTGLGIHPDHMDMLFKPFVQLDSGLTRQHEGTGLGLILVARLTEMHGGSVQVESQPGVGSRFTVMLPIIPFAPRGEGNSKEACSPADSLPAPTGNSDTSPMLCIANDTPILLVEDNESIISAYTTSLTLSGYHVNVARNGAEALERVQEELFTAIIMDIQLPVMDGLEATRRLRLLPYGATIPIIVLTSLVRPGDEERCRASGANYFLPKPVSSSKIQALLDAIVIQDRTAP